MPTVMILPADKPSAATVYADGKPVGKIESVEAAALYEGLDGSNRKGTRWLPEGLPSTLTPGPTTKNEAALLLLALEGFDPAAAAKALGMGALLAA